MAKILGNSVYDKLYQLGSSRDNKDANKSKPKKKAHKSNNRFSVFIKNFSTKFSNLKHIKRINKIPKYLVIIPAILFVVVAIGFSYFGGPLETIFAKKLFDIVDPKPIGVASLEAFIAEAEIPVRKDNAVVLGISDDTLQEADSIYQVKLEEQRRIEEEKRKYEAKIKSLDVFLAKQKSPMYGHAKLIVESSKKCGIDYRDALALAMKESGLGRAMRESEKGTAWGYLDGVKGETWEQAIPRVTCAVASKYIVKHGGMTVSLAKSYGPKSWTIDEAQTWLNHILRYKAMMPAI